MSAHEHRALADKERLKTGVITVSSTRTAADDTSGPLIAEALRQAGHEVAQIEIVDDEIDAIQAAVQRHIQLHLSLVVLTGGTGLTPRDVTPEAVEPLFTRSIPGFGELFRWLSFEQVGAAAMLSRATAGMVGQTAVFALPGSKKACALAMERLIVPEARHLASLARKVEQVRKDRGWRAAIEAMSGELELAGKPEPLPDGLAGLKPVQQLLAQAGERATLVVGDWRYSLWGFPDLRAASSRVLAVSVGGTLAEVLALHRWPVEVGTCIRGEGGWLTSRDTPVAAAGVARTGQAPPEGGALFAVAEREVFVERETGVYAWDGERMRELGSPANALVALMRDWVAK